MSVLSDRTGLTADSSIDSILPIGWVDGEPTLAGRTLSQSEQSGLAACLRGQAVMPGDALLEGNALLSHVVARVTAAGGAVRVQPPTKPLYEACGVAVTLGGESLLGEVYGEVLTPEQAARDEDDGDTGGRAWLQLSNVWCGRHDAQGAVLAGPLAILLGEPALAGEQMDTYVQSLTVGTALQVTLIGLTYLHDDGHEWTRTTAVRIVDTTTGLSVPGAVTVWSDFHMPEAHLRVEGGPVLRRGKNYGAGLVVD